MLMILVDDENLVKAADVKSVQPDKVAQSFRHEHRRHASVHHIVYGAVDQLKGGQVVQYQAVRQQVHVRP